MTDASCRITEDPATRGDRNHGGRIGAASCPARGLHVQELAFGLRRLFLHPDGTVMLSRLIPLALTSLALSLPAGGCATRQPDASGNPGDGGAATGSGMRRGSRIDGERAINDVRTLAADSFAGRRVGTPGGLKARAYVEAAMRQSGARMVGGSYVHPIPFRRADSSVVDAANVIGYVQGTRRPGRYIVISGHYDHVGIGRVVAGDSIYNGADDNASGTAAMLELARYFAANRPEHSILFVGFDAEEGGLRGARAFVENPPVPRDSIVMNVNMDMISRSEKGELYAVGTYAYPALRPYIERAQVEARIRLLTGHEGPTATGSDNWTNSSDHGPFNRAGIPFLYFGVEDHPGYHQPSDEFQFITQDFYVNAIETVLDVVLGLDRELEPVMAARKPAGS